MANELNRSNIQANLSPIIGSTKNVSSDLRTSKGKFAQSVYDSQTPNFYSPSNSPTFKEDEHPDDTSAAFNQLEVPTSSTNYSRPRTVAAGYDPERQTMTVVFRDGTFYNYYQVTANEWAAFHSSYSKGNPWLNKGFVNGNQKVDGIFISKPRGPISPDDIDPRVREQLYRVSRTQQIVHEPRKGRTTTTWNHAEKGASVQQYRDSWTTTPNRTKADLRRKTAGLNKSQTRNGNRKAS
jgi:hypothetical protein